LFEDPPGASAADSANSNNLDDNNTVGRSTSGHLSSGMGQYAVFNTTGPAFLDCSDANCPDLGNPTTGLTSFGWWYTGEDANQRLIWRVTPGQEGYGEEVLVTSRNKRCVIADGTSTIGTLTGNTFALNTWTWLGCSFDDSANQIHHLRGGIRAANTTVGGLDTIVNGNADFDMSNGGGVSQLNGRGDEMVLSSEIWLPDALCKGCACGPTGHLCACDPDTPANYQTCTTNADCQGPLTPDAQCDPTNNLCQGVLQFCDHSGSTCDVAASIAACNDSVPAS
jgi:hypothetical protein